MKIAVIDSGINLEYEDFDYAKFEIIDFTKTTGRDICGHGTACCGEIVNWKKNSDFLILKVLDRDNRTSLNILYEALSYCLYRNDVRIINISCAWNSLDQEINYTCYNLIQKLTDSGKIVISSFENNKEERCVSYPAAFTNTWGVQHKYSITDKIVYDSRKRNCVFYGSYNLMPNKNGDYNFFRGNSGFSARLSGILYYYMENLGYKDIIEIIENFNKSSYHNLQTENKEFFTKHDLYECLLNVNYEKYSRIFEQQEKGVTDFISEKECLEILKIIEVKKEIKIEYIKFSCEDFCNINKIIEKINKYAKK